LSHFGFKLLACPLGLLRIWQDGKGSESGKTEKGSAISAPSKRVSSDICSIERLLNAMTRQPLA
jgi:hypothetical protein